MTARKDTLFEQFLAPLFGLVIDRQALSQYRKSKDWEQEADRFRQPHVSYPDYYQSQNFHGIAGGYLTADAAVTYDPVTQYVMPPNETWIRQGLVERVRCQPRSILDLGCGTGSTTLLLKQAFPQAEVIGLDLSPYMLVAAQDKAQKAGLSVQFLQGNAEQTGFSDDRFDLVTASLLFHETPTAVACRILQECFRLLKVGGEVLILDGNQATLRWATWLTEIFEEPYIQEFAAGSVDAWMGAVGFGDVRTEEVWWLNQVTRGVKPLPYEKVRFEQVEMDARWMPSPG